VVEERSELGGGGAGADAGHMYVLTEEVLRDEGIIQTPGYKIYFKQIC
jgi:hypothetical protein